jgi:hypothetical protein
VKLQIDNDYLLSAEGNQYTLYHIRPAQANPFAENAEADESKIVGTVVGYYRWLQHALVGYMQHAVGNCNATDAKAIIAKLTEVEATIREMAPILPRTKIEDDTSEAPVATDADAAKPKPAFLQQMPTGPKIRPKPKPKPTTPS